MGVLRATPYYEVYWDLQQRSQRILQYESFADPVRTLLLSTTIIAAFARLSTIIQTLGLDPAQCARVFHHWRIFFRDNRDRIPGPKKSQIIFAVSARKRRSANRHHGDFLPCRKLRSARNCRNRCGHRQIWGPRASLLLDRGHTRDGISGLVHDAHLCAEPGNDRTRFSADTLR